MVHERPILRAVLGLLAAFALVIPLVNLLGGALSDAMRLGPGDARLAMDLAWIFVAGVAGSYACLRIASGGFLAVAAAFFLLALLLDLWAVVDFWNDWPRWFSLGVVLSLPLQVALGWWLCRTHRRRRAASAPRPGEQ